MPKKHKCGRKPLELLGKRFDRLMVVAKAVRSKDDKDRHTLWVCRCDCGNMTKSTGSNLKLGRVRSCGCLRDEKITAIGRSNRGLPVSQRTKQMYRHISGI